MQVSRCVYGAPDPETSSMSSICTIILRMLQRNAADTCKSCQNSMNSSFGQQQCGFVGASALLQAVVCPSSGGRALHSRDHVPAISPETKQKMIPQGSTETAS